MGILYKADWTIGVVPRGKEKKHFCLFGLTGSGKTTLSERIAEVNYLQKHYKIVSVFDSKHDFESAWTAFPSSGLHKRILETSEQSEGLPKEAITPTAYPTRIFHPVCRLLPSNVPDIFFPYTIPLDSISKSELQFLAESGERNVTLDILQKALELLTKNKALTLPELLYSLRGNDSNSSADFFGLQEEIASKQTQRTAINLFLQFSTHKFLSSSKNPLALTEKKLIAELNDQKTFTVFSGRYLGDKKLEFFCALAILNQIIKLKRLGKVKSDICVTLHDLYMLCPRYFTQEYEKTMTDLLYEILTTCRSAGIQVLADSQDPTGLAQRLCGQFSEVLTGYVWSPNELQYFAESGAMLEAFDKWQINNLRFKKQKSFFDLHSKDWVQIIPARHAHKGEGEDFFQTWKKHGKPFKDISNEIKEAEKEFDEAVKIVSSKSKEEKEIKPIKKIPAELLEKKSFVRADVEKALDCNKTYAKRIIKNWIETGLIKMHGEPRSKNCYYKIK